MSKNSYTNQYEHFISPKQLTDILTECGIRIVRDGVIPPQVYKDSSIQSFDFSDVKRIGTGAFANSGITSVVLAKDQVVEPYAFMNSAVEELKVSSKVTLGNGAFLRCNNLKELYIPAGTKLQNNVFATCVNLEEVVIDDGRTEFTPGVFAHVRSIPILYVPRNPDVFDMFSDLKRVRSLNIIGPRDEAVEAEIKKAISSRNITVNELDFTG